MFVFLLQAALLLAIAFILGAVIGCLLRTQFNPRPEPAGMPEPASQPASAARNVAPAAQPETGDRAEMAEAAAPAATKTAKPKTAAKSPAKASAKAPEKKTGKKTAAPRKAAKAATRTAPARKGAAAAGKPDDLKRIKGVGPRIEEKLVAAGITRYAQIAEWTKKDVAEWGEKLSFAGRIEREDWVAQAKKLASGEMTEFATRVSRGEVASSKAAPKRGTRKNGKA